MQRAIKEERIHGVTASQMNQLLMLRHRYNGWVRMQTRLTNSIKGYVRNFFGEVSDNETHGAIKRTPKSDKACAELDKMAEQMLSGKLKEFTKPKGMNDMLWLQIQPMLLSRFALSEPLKHVVKDIETVAAQLPIAAWITNEVKGVGLFKLGLLVGTVNPSKCETVAKFWFMLGIGIAKNGKRQQLSDPTAKYGDQFLWEIYKYSPQRRAMVWNIGDGILKAQIRKVKDKAGNDTGERKSLGIYGQKYLERKQYEREQAEERGQRVIPAAKFPKNEAERKKCMSEIHVHRRAQRYMEKAFLRDFWIRWTDTPWVNWADR